jgi:hypothetical protein
MDRRSINTLVLFGLACFLIGCQTFYTATVTLTKVVESASREYARAYNDGFVTPALAAKVAEAHEAWRKAAGVAQSALIAYRDGDDPAKFEQAMISAKLAAEQFIALIVPFLTEQQEAHIRVQLAKATKP